MGLQYGVIVSMVVFVKFADSLSYYLRKLNDHVPKMMPAAITNVGFGQAYCRMIVVYIWFGQPYRN